LAASNALAQVQVVKPPVAQYWMDVATISMAGMDDMPDMGALGGMLGGMTGMGQSAFGATRGMMPGRWLDIAVRTQLKPAGTQAQQNIPPAQNMGDSLTLLPVKSEPKPQKRPTGQPGSVDEVPPQPKGRILLYWGCSETVRPGQPRVLDFAKSGPQEYGKFMMGRAVRDNGAKAVPGHSIWPNETHRQKVPPDASLQGQHAVLGEGLPASLQFAIGQAQDFMPKMGLSSSGGGAAAAQVRWQAIPTAQAYFLNAMSGSDQDNQMELVIWSSSDVPEPGWGLMDYASNANVDKWLKEKVLLPATQSQCAVPAGIFAKSEGVMIRGIAYGRELNLAHPPRPEDKRIAWEPEWAAKIRVKSMAMAMLGEASDEASGRQDSSSAGSEEKEPSEQKQESLIPKIQGVPDLGKALKGLFGN